jgi:glutamate N-acetyltransferase/amino-acid N-acetyltransferase
MHVIDGGITAPQGFKATGKHIGIKKVKKDLALLSSDVPAEAAGVYTTSLVKAAPILWNKNLTDSGKKIKGLVCISGNANACTGNKGIRDNETMAETFAQCIGAKKDEILTAATGIIGLDMPMDTIINGINDTHKNLSNKRDEAKNAAAGIITTDTFIKEMAVQLNIGGKSVKIGAMCKGSGMIHPNMATVLSFITTDLNISRELLHKALLFSVKETYNMISVDGATSTNDMCLIMANGMAENAKITEENEFYEAFKNALYFINEKFAKDIVHDGEGASKFIEVNVNGAESDYDARLLAKSIVTNNLVKTAMYGEDANWGRVVAAMGGSGGYFNPSKVDISFESEKGKVLLMKHGEPVHFDENEAADVLSERDITVQITLEDGIFTAKSWGCDLGHEYVRINGEYRSRT